MEMEGIDEVFQLCRFNPSPMDAVTYFLPRLISGEPMHGAERLIHRADVYACEPKDLAAKFAPVPQSVRSDDRFFFTLCKRQKGSGKKISRGAGGGTWVSQSTKDIRNDAGVKVGEIKKLSFKKGKETTGWVMEEYRCCLQEAVVADGEKVMCKIHLSPNAGSVARQESAAYLRRRQEEEPVPQPQPVSTHAPKRPAPVAADPPCPKRTRVAVLTAPAAAQQVGSAGFAPQPPAFTEAPGAGEADGDMDRFACSLDELLGVCGAEEEEAKNDIDQFAATLDGILSGAEEEEEQTLPADDKEQEPEQQQVVLASDEFAIPTLDELSVIFNLDDMESFTVDDLDMLPADGEEAEQQVLTSDDSAMASKNDLEEFLERYKREESWPIFRLDELEGHSEFFSF